MRSEILSEGKDTISIVDGYPTPKHMHLHLGGYDSSAFLSASEARELAAALIKHAEVLEGRDA